MATVPDSRPFSSFCSYSLFPHYCESGQDLVVIFDVLGELLVVPVKPFKSVPNFEEITILNDCASHFKVVLQKIYEVEANKFRSIPWIAPRSWLFEVTVSILWG
ncbi:hypothetical protein CSKR_201038 [Clonorchis sinensis]|uniref:Uncharacterized protein n=1 Tax=Clonorchis sinensis TaxID=79923 RepID=A0A8T1MLP3_CLOSI|nr:hypothetical protein CSKR_201038 [Clonorchis sinensis]